MNSCELHCINCGGPAGFVSFHDVIFPACSDCDGTVSVYYDVDDDIFSLSLDMGVFEYCFYNVSFEAITSIILYYDITQPYSDSKVELNDPE